ncbi:putative Uncharacterized HTH-type transcriptional regulator YagI [Syntrophobacter sp. SbD1]|nr:putative Uncharacterized HTH-type transcriptional regulator YagI [Syntrophobacter sp. SbD1]
MGLTELSEALNLSKATVLRLASTLCKHGFLNQDSQSKKYSLGVKLFELGSIVYNSFSLRKTASRHLRLLHEKVGKTVFLGILQGDELLYLDKKENLANPIRFASNIGTRRPPHFGMLGQVLMAHLSEGEVQRLLRKYPLTAFTKRSMTSEHVFKEKLQEVRRQGFVAEDGVALEGIGGIAAPVRDFSGSVVGAIGIGFLLASVSAKDLKVLTKEILETATTIGHELGHAGA